MTTDSPVLLLSQCWTKIVGCSTQDSNYRFLACIQVSQEPGKIVWYYHLSKNFPQFIMIHTIKGFRIADETEVDVFLEFTNFLYDPANVGNLVSDSLSFSKPDLDICKF